MPWWWLLGGIWAASDVAVVVCAYLVWNDPDSEKIWEEAQSWVVAALCGFVLVSAPFWCAYGIRHAGPRAVKWLVGRLFLGRTADPFSAPEAEWRSDRDGFLCDLIRRRQMYDARLKGEKIGRWPMFRCWAAPEAAILEVVDGYRDLHAAGLADTEIWTRMDRHLGVVGEPVRNGAGPSGYLMSRMANIDPGMLVVGGEFLSRHVDICGRWLERWPQMQGYGCCPLGWLAERLTLEKFEAGTGVHLHADGAPAVLAMGGLDRPGRELAAIKLRILDGDEVWSFSSPNETWRNMMGTAGYALVRAGRVVAHAVTAMN